MSYSRLLSIIGRIHPQAWDAIIPHGPRLRVLAGVERVALNPQPLPPREAFLLSAAELAHDLVRAAVATEMRGEPSSALVTEIIDDWCGTLWPRKWPWPWPGPRPGEGPESGPLPDPWDVKTAQIIGAVVFASMASRLSEGDLSTALSDGADRLTETVLASSADDDTNSIG